MFRITAVLAAGITAAVAAIAPQKHASPVTEVTVTATDFKFDAPATVPAGLVRFNLVNKGTTFHHMALARLNDGHTLQELGQAMSKPGPAPEWFVPMGGPNAPAPGGTSNATIALEPGNYVIMCFVSTPQDPQPHFLKGMMQPLTVTASKPEKSSLANADVTILLADYGFVPNKELKAGKHTIRVENKGPQQHELELIRLAPGKTVQDMMAWLEKMDSPPPGEALGGVAGMAPDQANNFDVDLTPGNYVMLCFIPDAKDGAPHFVHGMVRPFTVK